MEIKITNAELINSFIPALRELSTFRTPIKVTYNTAKTIKAVSTYVEAYEEARKAIIETRCVKENGKPKTENNEYVFESEELKSESISLIQELSAQLIDIQVYPISLSEMGSTEISAQTLLALKEFIQE